MKKILFVALAALMFTSCNDDDNNDNGRIPISLSSRLTVDLPRISRQDTQIAGGQEVSFFVTQAGVPGEIAYNNAMLTADGSGNFSYTYGGASNTTLYYPLYPTGVDFYAIHPYNAITLGTDYNFNVQQNQSEIRSFLNSDLLFAKEELIAPSRNPVRLTFEHKLAKVNFVVIAGPGTELTGLSSIEILGAQQQAVLNTITGAVTTGTAAPTIDVTAYGLADDYATVEPDEASDIAAIIVPQTFAANQPLFRMTINGVNFTYTPSAPASFAAGTSYTYRLTLTGATITVTSSIKPWTAAEDQEGEGIIE